MRVRFKSFKEAVSQPSGRYFRVSRKNGVLKSGDDMSFYSRNLDDEHLTFDVSNNKVLANIAPNGVIRSMSIYRGCYPADCIPGVWMCKDLANFGPLFFTIHMENEVYSLAEVTWDYETVLLDNIFPVTVLKGKGIRVTSIVYAPVSEDGTKRPRGVVYGIILENTSQKFVKGKVILPSTFSGNMYSDITGGAGGAGVVNMIEREKAEKDVKYEYWEDVDALIPVPLETKINLAPGEYAWIPAVISAFGDSAPHDIEKKGTLYWLNATWSYYRGRMGRLKIKNDCFSQEFMERCFMQCLGTVAMDGKGSICGANWGTYPSTQYTWMKDMFYALMPMCMFDTDIFRKGMEWFFEWSIRPRGNRGIGGIRHSLGNSLTPLVMAGLYYRYTADNDYFVTHPEIRRKMEGILEQILLSRQYKEIYLFPSVWLSDGPSCGDWHTGSNVLAWYAFYSFSNILEKAFGDEDTSARYRDIADKIKSSIEKYCIIKGPFGYQFIEGVNSDGSIPRMHHEGEESDTTLMPFYGFVEYNNPAYRNYMRFSMSEYNRSYNPVTRGISWHAKKRAYTDGTFPGFMTGLANVVDETSMNCESGYMTEIRKLTDVDGSVWWWPYNGNGCEYGQVTRGVIGKSAWASGVFICLFITQILGIEFDAVHNILRLRPAVYTSGFSWKEMRFGKYYFDIELIQKEKITDIKIKNRNKESLKLCLEVPVKKGTVDLKIEVDGKRIENYHPEYKEFLNKKILRFKRNLQKSSSIKIKIKWNIHIIRGE